MARPVLVYVHGWGFDGALWAPLRAALPDFPSIVFDLGFFGAPAEPPVPGHRPVVAIGHSFGVLWLLHRQPFAWAGLVAINGFPRFTEAPDFAPAVPGRVLARMIARLDSAPATVVAEFRRRCGLAGPPPAVPDADRLRAGLMALRDWDARPALARLGAPVLALAGGRDPIVPPAMAAHAFRAAPSLTQDVHAEAGHLLPLTAPAWCAGHIRRFVAGLPGVP